MEGWKTALIAVGATVGAAAVLWPIGIWCVVTKLALAHRSVGRRCPGEGRLTRKHSACLHHTQQNPRTTPLLAYRYEVSKCERPKYTVVRELKGKGKKRG